MIGRIEGFSLLFGFIASMDFSHLVLLRIGRDYKLIMTKCTRV